MKKNDNFLEKYPSRTMSTIYNQYHDDDNGKDDDAHNEDDN